MAMFINYILHLLAAFVLLGAFAWFYTWVTPFDEMALIRRGCVSAALTLGGALLGFSLTLASSILHSDNLIMFLIWGGASMVVQIVTYGVLTRFIPDLNQSLEDDNTAMASLMGAVALTVGVLNAASLS